MSLLEIEDLQVRFGTDDQALHAVHGLSLSVNAGESLGLVGESGSGKSVAMLALLGLIAAPGKVSARRLRFADTDLLTAKPKALRNIVGKDIAMVFQDPMGSLNPAYPVGAQIVEVLRAHAPASARAMRAKATELLGAVGIPEPGARYHAYAHQLSGGLCQRVMIAMAIACEPRLLIADEPTTALDVTVQAQILDLLLELQARRGMALILISHDLAVVSSVVENTAVMYAGEIIESAPTRVLFETPLHPYTQALLGSIPESNPVGPPLFSLPGIVPGRAERLGDACLLAKRCPQTQSVCLERRPPLHEQSLAHWVRCQFVKTPVYDRAHTGVEAL